MEIAVYMSEVFANEDTKLYRPEEAYREDIMKDGKTPVFRRFYNTDKSTTTTLRKLYREGWKISQITRGNNLIHIFFMERH